MLKVAIFGAAGKMGTRACDRLKDVPEYQILYVEPVPAGQEALKARAVKPTPVDEAARTADVLIMAINDRALPKVASDVVPMMKSGAMLFMLDPAAAYAEALPKRQDITIFVTHPAHPPLYNDETTPEARKDYFGGGFAKQAIVSALMQGPETDYDKGEAISRRFFGPILRSHRITVEQMAILEPATVETCTATCILACREALDEAIRRGVPEQAAKDFVMGHINIQLALIFDQLNWRMSDGALLMLKDGMQACSSPTGKMSSTRLRSSIACGRSLGWNSPAFAGVSGPGNREARMAKGSFGLCLC